MSKAFKKWVARIEDTTTPWSEQDIIYFRKAVGSSGIKDIAERELLRRMFAERALAGAVATVAATALVMMSIKRSAIAKNMPKYLKPVTSAMRAFVLNTTE